MTMPTLARARPCITPGDGASADAPHFRFLLPEQGPLRHPSCPHYPAVRGCRMPRSPPSLVPTHAALGTWPLGTLGLWGPPPCGSPPSRMSLPSAVPAVAPPWPAQGCAWLGLRGRGLLECFLGTCFTSRKCPPVPGSSSARGSCGCDSAGRKLPATPKLPGTSPACPALPGPQAGARPSGCSACWDAPKA